MRYVVIGNGIAGVHALETIRKLDPNGSITLVAGETFPPYCRPMISLVLDGSLTEEDLPVRGPDFYEALGVEAFVGEHVVDLDAERRVLTTDRNRNILFDRLLIASGANPRRIKAQGLELGRIFFMRNQMHVRDMIASLDGVEEALVLGGGLVGFKAAYSLMKRGVRVTMLIRSGYPLSMQVDAHAGSMILDELVKNGLTVRVGAEVIAFEGNGFVRAAHLEDGSTISCGMVVIGKGVRPATSFLRTQQIAVDLGVLVDERLQTSVPGIFAAGDVAEHYDVARKSRWVNAIWPVAVEQGRVAGMNMAGRDVSYKGSLSRNVIRIFDLDVLTGGLVNPPDDSYLVLTRMDPRRRTYRKLVFRDGRLVGLVMVNEIEQGGVLLSLIHGGHTLPIEGEAVLEPSFNVARLFPHQRGFLQARRTGK
ncbi:MAG: NAD(P)/FAD-dependent oxidoreductase [Deltaproteobacteria bacterium]|nr:NAD(P)/FAD-dependent oxidoreductase [Deltaproteobacteria bacterium]